MIFHSLSAKGNGQSGMIITLCTLIYTSPEHGAIYVEGMELDIKIASGIVG